MHLESEGLKFKISFFSLVVVLSCERYARFLCIYLGQEPGTRNTIQLFHEGNKDTIVSAISATS